MRVHTHNDRGNPVEETFLTREEKDSPDGKMIAIGTFGPLEAWSAAEHRFIEWLKTVPLVEFGLYTLVA